jgi:hypothetical protein
MLFALERSEGELPEGNYAAGVTRRRVSVLADLFLAVIIGVDGVLITAYFLAMPASARVVIIDPVDSGALRFLENSAGFCSGHRERRFMQPSL